MRRTLLALAIAGLSVAAYASPPPGGGPPTPIDVNVINPVVPASVVSPMGVTSHLGLCSSPQPGSECVIANITGKGTFLSGLVAKQGGANDITSVELTIDGRILFSYTFAALKNLNLTQTNASGEAVFSGEGVDDIDTVVIGFPYPIPFESSLVMKAVVGTYDTGIVQIAGKVIAGSQ